MAVWSKSFNKFKNSLTEKKKQCGPIQNGQCKKVVKSKEAVKNGCDGICRSMAKILITTI